MTSQETQNLPPAPPRAVNARDSNEGGLPPPLRQRPSDEALDQDFALDVAFVGEVKAALRADDKERARILVAFLHYADLAELLERLDAADRRLLVEDIRDVFNADVLPELSAEVRHDVMDALGFESFANAFEQLDSDDAVYVASKLEDGERAHLLELLPAEKRQQIEQDLAHGEDSAGRLMQRELVAVPSYWSVGETIDYLRATRNVPAKFYVVFVVDPRHRPLGVVELHRVLTSSRSVAMNDIIDPEMEMIPTDMDREQVAHLFRKRNFAAVPVIDKSGRLVGQITIDDVVDVIDQEAGEDILKLAGVRTADESSLYRSIMVTAQSRFMWLFINLGTAFLASSVVGVFEESIAKLSALAVLMPICASMGGNAGTQTLATVVRGLATRDLNSGNALRIAWKEIAIGMINGLLFAAITGGIAWVWFNDDLLGIVIGAALVANMLAAGAAGIFIPVVLDKMGFDPADSAVVFLTTVTDVVGFFSFLGLATWILL